MNIVEGVNMEKNDILIIGAGPAGLSAAIMQAEPVIPQRLLKKLAPVDK